MFESDDYDEILSQVDFTEFDVKPRENTEKQNVLQKENSHKNTIKERTLDINQLVPGVEKVLTENVSENSNKTNQKQNDSCETITSNRNSLSPKHAKRKIIDSYFDHKSKRKFPGPAGLLVGSFEENNDHACHMEFLSQDIDFTENCLHGNVFDTPLWMRLLKDTEPLQEINCINVIKQKALAGQLRRKKAEFVRAFIESVDRSAIDPLLTLRDKTGNIKCTLHRDAWTAFSTYIASEYCAIVLCKPTVLTIGSSLKRHYLNITLSNILAIYSSAIIDDNNTLPDGYHKVNEEDCTVIKMERPDLSTNEALHNSLDFLDDLDDVFVDDMF